MGAGMWWLGGKAKVLENRAAGVALGDDGEDAHRAAAVIALEDVMANTRFMSAAQANRRGGSGRIWLGESAESAEPEEPERTTAARSLWLGANTPW
jgi:hypothetical protein